MNEVKHSVGKTVLISGASSGVGRATAELLAREGANVVLFARRRELLHEAVAGIERNGGRALAVVGDVSDEISVNDAVQQVVETFGGLDAVINNAALGLIGGVEDFSYNDWQQMTRTNLDGVFLLSKAAIKPLRERGGHIITIGSEFSRNAMPGLAAYCATKWGALGLMQTLAMELREFDIRCSSVLPGGILTDFGPDDVAGKQLRRERGERFLEPSDVAEAVLFLLTQPTAVWTQELDLRPY